MNEYQTQKLFVQWFHLQYPKHLINGDVGGVWTRNFAQARKNKCLGHSNGYPDIFIPEPSSQHRGLFIEMKTSKKSYPTKEQIYWIEELNNRGYFAVVCYGFDEAKRVVQDYFKEEK